MSKNKMLAIAALATFGFSFAASAEITARVQKGSSRSRVEEVQAALNLCSDANLVEDGLWGAKTTAAVKAFQADNGLSTVGTVGPQTAAALNDCVNSSEEEEDDTTTTTTTTTTADLCPNGMTLASNCTVAPTTTTTTTTTLSGPEGNLSNIARLGSYNSTKVSESDKDVKVYGVELTAKDGDQKIDGLNVAFYNSNGSSSKKFTKYASEVSVWLDGVEIGRKLVSQYSDDASDVYTYRFSGMNGIIKMNQKSQLIVAVTGVSSMDSTDATNETWAVEAGSSVGGTNTNYISAASANGRYRDFGGDLASSTIDFQKAGGVSSDQKYKVTLSSTNPVAQNVQVSTTTDTSDKTLLAFDVKAENGAMVLQKLPITLSTTGTDAVSSNAAVVKTLKLYVDGVNKGSESIVNAAQTTNASCTASATPFTWCTGAGTGTAPTNGSSEVIVFGNTSKLGLKIAANSTVKVEIRADLNDTEDTGVVATDFDNGDAVKAEYTSTNLTNTTVELDNVNQDTVSNKSGTALGELQTLRSNGAVATMGTPTIALKARAFTGDTSNNIVYTIPVTVQAFEDTIYVGQTSQAAAAGAITGTNAFSFSLNDSSTPSTQDTACPTGTLSNPISSNATTVGSSWMLPAGQSKTFTVQVICSAPTAAANIRVQLNDMKFFTDSALSTGATVQNLVPMSSFQTNYNPIF